jgi:hypothetical protein
VPFGFFVDIEFSFNNKVSIVTANRPYVEVVDLKYGYHIAVGQVCEKRFVRIVLSTRPIDAGLHSRILNVMKCVPDAKKDCISAYLTFSPSPLNRKRILHSWGNNHAVNGEAGTGWIFSTDIRGLCYQRPPVHFFP